MSWLTILRRAIELFVALARKLGAAEPAAGKPTITRASVDAQLDHQRELYRRNHPEKSK